MKIKSQFITNHLSISIAIGTAILITLYEFSKQAIFPQITLWESHIITIIFCTIIAFISVHFTLKIHKKFDSKNTIALKESESRFRQLFEENIDAIFWADGESGIIIDCNKAAEILNRSRSI